MILLLTHLGCFVIGAASWRWFTMWEGRRVTEHQTGDTSSMSNDRPPADTHTETGRFRWSTLGLLAIVVSLAIVGFGIQQSQFQKDQQTHDECVDSWGAAYRHTTVRRTNALKDLEKANRQLGRASKARDDALDNIVLFIISSRSADPPPPPEVTDRQFGVVLRRFAAAKANLERVQDRVQTTTADVKETRQSNPYPVLHCSGDPDDDSTSSSPHPTGGE